MTKYVAPIGRTLTEAAAKDVTGSPALAGTAGKKNVVAKGPSEG